MPLGRALSSMSILGCFTDDGSFGILQLAEVEGLAPLMLAMLERGVFDGLDTLLDSHDYFLLPQSLYKEIPTGNSRKSYSSLTIL